jgi:hypothetical protein
LRETKYEGEKKITTTTTTKKDIEYLTLSKNYLLKLLITVVVVLRN